VAAVFTPRDFGITAIIGRIVDEIRLAHKLQPWSGRPATLAGTTGPAGATTIEG
jgi:(2R)-ethylmalonyl-CoA mutase